jgi:hypothetical protein
MQQIYEMEEKPVTSSFNICSKAAVVKRGGRSNIPPPVDISLKDDVTVIVLLGISSMRLDKESYISLRVMN